ncbi:MAG: hypothetical protein L0207_02160 [Chlamydiae bacterium]|nr:hypothetical protein [Chlamydiota bacterium]
MLNDYERVFKDYEGVFKYFFYGFTYGVDFPSHTPGFLTYFSDFSYLIRVSNNYEERQEKEKTSFNAKMKNLNKEVININNSGTFIQKKQQIRTEYEKRELLNKGIFYIQASKHIMSFALNCLKYPYGICALSSLEICEHLILLKNHLKTKKTLSIVVDLCNIADNIGKLVTFSNLIINNKANANVFIVNLLFFRNVLSVIETLTSFLNFYEKDEEFNGGMFIGCLARSIIQNYCKNDAAIYFQELHREYWKVKNQGI